MSIRSFARTLRERPSWLICGLIAVGSLVFAPVSSPAASQPVVAASTTQLVVAIADSWDAQRVSVYRYARQPSKAWVREGAVVPGRIGLRGLSWGRGLHPAGSRPSQVREKREGDKRSPAGVFKLGTVFGYPAQVPHKPSVNYVQVTNRDLLVEDPASPQYNTHVRLERPAKTAWELANRMELTDPAHELKVFVHHNTDPVVPGKGSAILLHLTRPDQNSFTVGCTAVDRKAMYELVAWLDGARRPLYVLLPQSHYDAVAEDWGLPLDLVRPVS